MAPEFICVCHTIYNQLPLLQLHRLREDTFLSQNTKSKLLLKAQDAPRKKK